MFELRITPQVYLSWLPIQLFGDSAALQALLLVLVELGLAVLNGHPRPAPALEGPTGTV
ncbi:hypothetical protein [Limosilactobacillus fermentum]|uniref:hypothetical protein n=1 Tax=Limosilactobacillus fermentum TaxID=1613 RepID=UPI0013DDAD7F|nr:hypothetical protein [Limosilactobacillus fermentum]